MGVLTKVRKKFSYVLLAGAILASPSAVGTALADAGRFYLGITGTPEWLDTSYKKTVDNTSPLNMTSQSGKVHRDRDSADATGYGFGLLAGYRWPLLDQGRLFLDSEFDIAFHGESTRGRLKGIGESEGRNQMGESWPDEFTTGATTHNENFTAWTSGAGLEKMFGSRLGLMGEVRYTGYLAEAWVSFNLKDEGVFVPVRVDNDEVNLSLTLAWYC